jgi:hypothetical protein
MDTTSPNQRVSYYNRRGKLSPLNTRSKSHIRHGFAVSWSTHTMLNLRIDYRVILIGIDTQFPVNEVLHELYPYKYSIDYNLATKYCTAFDWNEYRVLWSTIVNDTRFLIVAYYLC